MQAVVGGGAKKPKAKARRRRLYAMTTESTSERRIVPIDQFLKRLGTFVFQFCTYRREYTDGRCFLPAGVLLPFFTRLAYPTKNLKKKCLMHTQHTHTHASRLLYSTFPHIPFIISSLLSTTRPVANSRKTWLRRGGGRWNTGAWVPTCIGVGMCLKVFCILSI